MFGEYFLRSIGVDSVAHRWPPGSSAAARHRAWPRRSTSAACTLGAAVVGATTVAKFGGLALIVVLAAFLLGGDAGASACNFAAAGAPVDRSDCSAWR